MSGVRVANRRRTRAALLDAARLELAAGFEEASIRSIARRAGVATGTVFNYFDDKLDLLHHVLHADLDEALALARAQPEDAPLREQLVGMAGGLLERFCEQPGLFRVLLKESLFAQGERGAAFRAQTDALADEVARRAARWDGLEPQVVALHFVSAWYFALISALASEPVDPVGARHRLALQLTAVTRGASWVGKAP